MTFKEIFANGLWLTAPPLLILAIVSPLPPGYRSEIFDNNIPRWVRLGENILRAVVFLLPTFLRLGTAGRVQQAGVALYLFGLAAYWVSWQAGGWFPASASAYLAPAWTPALWLAGISLLARNSYLSVPYRPWMYLVVSAAFLAFHNYHAWIVWSRKSAWHFAHHSVA